MSKYTTEVRFICEQKAGLEDSKGFNDVDDVLDDSWDKIFTTQATIFDEEYRPIICKKILKHYYTREIGAETVGLWLLWMNRKLEEILPYYNQLWSSAELEFDPFNDVDWTREGRKTGNNAEVTTETHSDTKTGSATEEVDNTYNESSSGTSGNTHYDKYSDTPQGALNGVDNDTYLTNARKVTDAGTTSGQGSGTSGTDRELETSESMSGNKNSNVQGSNTESYTERLAGKMNSRSYQELLQKLRETFINIDMLVIEEFSDLFMNVW